MSEAQRFSALLLPEEAGAERDWWTDHVFLREIEFQCSIAKLAQDRLNEAAVKPVEPDKLRTWDAVQSLMVAVANIAKLLDGSSARTKEGRVAAMARAERLRRLTSTGRESVLLDRGLRNDLEHFDERLDVVLADVGWHVHSDRAIHRTGQRHVFFRNDEHGAPLLPLRELAVDINRLTVLDRDLCSHAVDLFALGTELGRLHKVVAALIDEPPPPNSVAVQMRGRFVPVGETDEKQAKQESD